MKLPLLSLTTKIVLMVATMGLAFAMITLYAKWHVQHIESQYQKLLEQQATLGNRLGLVRQHLGDTTALVHMVPTTVYEDQLHLTQEQLAQMQKAFEANLDQIYTLLPDHDFQLDQVLIQSRHMFAGGQRVITSHLRWRDEDALLALSQSFTPALKKLKVEIDTLHNDAQKVFEAASKNLEAHTQQTINHTTLAGWLSVVLISACVAWIALRHVSRPISRLIGSMQLMSLHHYDTLISDQERGDEIGSMARELQNFGKSLQEAERVERELAVQHQNLLWTERLQQMTSALPGAVFQVQLSPDGTLSLRFVSPQWTQLMGAPPQTCASLEKAVQVIPRHDRKATSMAENCFKESAKTLEPVDFDVSIVMLDGVTRWINTRANPHQESDGSIIFNGVWMDVTKEMMQSRALEKAKRQAEQSAIEKSTLQASISHEIRTPLNAILGLTQLLLKADLPQPQREQLHHILRAGQHLRGIVNEVLDFSKIDAGQLKLESTDFSLENVVQDVLSMCQEEASKKGLSLSYKMAREMPDSLRGDPHRIAQILLNYVNNAIKFTTCGSIHIAMRLDASSTLHRIVLHASVKDTGPGIPADRLPTLFDAFQQADNSITRRFGGTGLGLTISRALAQLMGGTAGVHSTLGLGSTFWFTAILEPARITVPRPQTHALEQQAHISTDLWQGLRILVVDDNPLNRAVAEGMLHALGLQTETAEDGAEALEKLQTSGPDFFACILMDIQMPNMDGISATQAIRQLSGFEILPIIAMTAHTAVQDVEHMHLAGMNAHLSKPLLESALHRVLQQWLGHVPQLELSSSGHNALSAPLPPEFDATAIDALAQLFDSAKLQQLITQFTHDSLQRASRLLALASQHDWPAMRAEVHKLTGTAATFGLMRLGHLSSALSGALKAADSERAMELAEQIFQSAQAGVAQLQTYCPRQA
ncbi:ATP-binding protein [Comamonas sp. NoAH]|uniref:ATP-binding protein n=1 Tax=Comamonas halotolerans TaxID=3041496 RepID=UPI0024E058A1|nr:ATP-binding protein [Comamonas sp. NoAH]